MSAQADTSRTARRNPSVKTCGFATSLNEGGKAVVTVFINGTAHRPFPTRLPPICGKRDGKPVPYAISSTDVGACLRARPFDWHHGTALESVPYDITHCLT